MHAGRTYLFTVDLLDIYSNAMSLADERIEILAEYQDHTEWPSPIGIPDLQNWQALYGTNIAGVATNNKDGSYQGQLTLYRAGLYQLSVKINDQHVVDSPWTPVLVLPTNLYAPSCVPLGVPSLIEAGSQYTFQIQTRDFYSNNLKSSQQDLDFQITFTSGDETVSATLQDDLDLGVLKVSFTLTKVGLYHLSIMLNGLEVPHSVTTIKVVPKQVTSYVTSRFTGVLSNYLTGESI